MQLTRFRSVSPTIVTRRGVSSNVMTRLRNGSSANSLQAHHVVVVIADRHSYALTESMHPTRPDPMALMVLQKWTYLINRPSAIEMSIGMPLMLPDTSESTVQRDSVPSSRRPSMSTFHWSSMT